jgi:hypothetical protein
MDNRRFLLFFKVISEAEELPDPCLVPSSTHPGRSFELGPVHAGRLEFCPSHRAEALWPEWTSEFSALSEANHLLLLQKS